MKIKICGVTNKNEISMLDSMKIDYCGLWWNVHGGKYNLENDKIDKLMKCNTDVLKKIVVTFEKNFENLNVIICNKNVYGIQLHGFQLPSLIKKIKTKRHDILVFKVLHVKGNECLEVDMVNRYLDSGADFFILDNYISQSRIGSTGKTLNLEYLKTFMANLDYLKVFIAGGISADNLYKFTREINFYGIDIDSSVRVGEEISQTNVLDIKNKLDLLRYRGRTDVASLV